MVDLASAQRLVDSVIRANGGYWPPLAGLARVLEEIGEVAGAIACADAEGLRKEAADCMVASIAIANQYCVNLDCALDETSVPLPSEALNTLLVQAGELARLVNRLEGIKPMKPSETQEAPAFILAKLFSALAGVASEKPSQVVIRAMENVSLNAKRDVARFVRRADYVTAESRDRFLAEVAADSLPHAPSAGLWGEVGAVKGLSSDAFASRREQVLHFARVDQAAPLVGMVLNPEEIPSGQPVAEVEKLLLSAAEQAAAGLRLLEAPVSTVHAFCLPLADEQLAPAIFVVLAGRRPGLEVRRGVVFRSAAV